MVFWPLQSLLVRKESIQSFLQLTELGHDLIRRFIKMRQMCLCVYSYSEQCIRTFLKIAFLFSHFHSKTVMFISDWTWWPGSVWVLVGGDTTHPYAFWRWRAQSNILGLEIEREREHLHNLYLYSNSDNLCCRENAQNGNNKCNRRRRGMKIGILSIQTRRNWMDKNHRTLLSL